MALFLDREIGSQMRGTGTPGAEGNNVNPLVEELSIPDMVSIRGICSVVRSLASSWRMSVWPQGLLRG